MVNVNKYIEWFYNLIYKSRIKKYVLKQKAHLLVYQNSHDLTDKEKAKITKYEEEAEEYRIMLQEINGLYEEYMHKKLEVVHD